MIDCQLFGYNIISIHVKNNNFFFIFSLLVENFASK